MINFYLNGKLHELTHLNPNTTVLEYLRLHERQTDTKEGCASGDCGACTVMAQRLPIDDIEQASATPFYTLNSCITLLSLMDGHHLMTAAYLADNPEHHPERALLHPAQQAMVDCHGSQCGFCTPGFVMSLASVYENQRLQKNQDTTTDDLDYDDIVASISGNLCRCTGYRPIIDAGLAMEGIGQQRDADQTAAKDFTINLATDAMASSKNTASTKLSAIKPVLTQESRKLFMPTSIDALNQVLAANPTATIWAGGTDLGLSVTQHMVDHEVIVQLSAIEELKSWSLTGSDEPTDGDKKTEQVPTQSLVLGAGMSYQQMLPVLEQYFPEFAAIFERIASPQIRNMGTIGGNIANASPIGDLPPILLALDAQVYLRHCASDSNDNNHSQASYTDETISLSAFFLDYKKTKLRAGSYVVDIHIPLMQDNQHLYIHKISKRYEDDISACLLAARIDLSADGKTIEQANLGLGGMAAIPLLAESCQQALIGQSVDVASFETAAQMLSMDVSPMTDVRASREYRMHVMQRLIIKCGKQLVAGMQPASA
ncbi:xanthine dehydrogenase small subunit [Psychrobacter sp. AOP22-C1-22]|uniref:xanthine dehydrogenase small subunit n=2 Tax=Psychrobacter TaxID=497 RepID=UPI001787F205|nr:MULTISPECIES: FAD binding domain-containing protein [unclassified Psychrobacter]MBE0407639.1 FAD binding domain-containing protein [Psychrobacter sp. FME6]MBE0445316.1 FAD binding domain-containing protein [Psychrobacter sp. FME5]